MKWDYRDGLKGEIKVDILRMSPQEFQEIGLLQEINRQFLHPRGLALEVLVPEDGGEAVFGEIWDYRDDPEGILFGDSVIDTDEARNKEINVSLMLRGVESERMKRLGWIVQPIPEKLEE